MKNHQLAKEEKVLTVACECRVHDECSGIKSGYIPRKLCECDCHKTKCPPHESMGINMVFEMPTPPPSIAVRVVILQFCKKCPSVFWEDGGEKIQARQANSLRATGQV